ncbi:hypothetical protein E8E13_009698 [Curvularia kusanoi]|uniref:Uncharacterized protein n=1 Tax=Curvularia kusanoi TaxID=90978 RepID=A0A9P4TFC0_CURKU|nr:hypothetical protein E8E13_009698 [Curvularia kusanoi]
MSSEFVPFDVGHVQEKLVEWYNNWASANREDYMGRISSSDVTAQADLRVSESLILRLACANIKRRRQLNYWSEHSDVPESAFVGITVRTSPEFQKSSLPLDPGNTGIGTSTSRKAPLPPSQMGKTVTSKFSFSTAVVSDMNVTRKGEEAHTQYEESVVGRFAPVSVPPLPRVAHAQEKFGELGKNTFSEIFALMCAHSFPALVVPDCIIPAVIGYIMRSNCIDGDGFA